MPWAEKTALNVHNKKAQDLDSGGSSQIPVSKFANYWIKDKRLDVAKNSNQFFFKMTWKIRLHDFQSTNTTEKNL